MSLFLIARLADRTVAIDSSAVEAVVDLGVITPVPGAPAAIFGLAALRSRVVTVIDTRAALGAPRAVDRGRAVVTAADGHHYAILVDGLEDVAELADSPVPLSWPQGSRWRAATRGIVEHEGEAIAVLDLTALIPTHANP